MILALRMEKGASGGPWKSIAYKSKRIGYEILINELNLI